jgi:hypothetical protein
MKSITAALAVVLASSLGLGCTAQGAAHGTDAGSAPQAQPATAAPKPAPPAPQPKGGPPEVNATGAATKQFLDRLQEYVTFHNNVEKMVPPIKETNDPAKISEREKALGAALIKQRPDAKPGDFFVKSYQPVLIKLIREDFAKRSPADRKALIVELPKGVKIAVNTIYPTTLPLATFPPNLLAALPELPKELEYRIVGRDLVLRDVTGNVIVDVMPNVFPIPT